MIINSEIISNFNTPLVLMFDNLYLSENNYINSIKLPYYAKINTIVRFGKYCSTLFQM